ncbi:DNA excision repair protein ERCC-5-like [Tubulanus polymorphus]|uniref:DNA excision repair protein ERCC-5-like n=1 Tax=Tubulanus polymorphus TaxID=672921 RepID=UPI003DA1E11F
MGVLGLWQLLESIGRPVTLESLEGKILAIDVSIWLHQAAKGMRDKQGNPLPNAHLIGLFNKCCKLLYYRIKPVFVFDGGVPALKRDTMNARRHRKETAEKRSEKHAQKILTNYVKSRAIHDVIGGDDTEAASVQPSTSHHRTTTDVDDLYVLPPEADNTDDKQHSDSNSLYTLGSGSEEDGDEQIQKQFQQHLKQKEFQDLDSIDFESEDFKSMPPEIQHEILSDLKEKNKRRALYRQHEMPEDSQNFSNYQVSKLMNQSRLSRRLNVVRSEMNEQQTGEIVDSLNLKGRSIETRRVQSEDSSHYILIKGLNKSLPPSTMITDRRSRQTDVITSADSSKIVNDDDDDEDRKEEIEEQTKKEERKVAAMSSQAIADWFASTQVKISTAENSSKSEDFLRKKVAISLESGDDIKPVVITASPDRRSFKSAKPIEIKDDDLVSDDDDDDDAVVEVSSAASSKKPQTFGGKTVIDCVENVSKTNADKIAKFDQITKSSENGTKSDSIRGVQPAKVDEIAIETNLKNPLLEEQKKKTFEKAEEEAEEEAPVVTEISDDSSDDDLVEVISEVVTIPSESTDDIPEIIEDDDIEGEHGEREDLIEERKNDDDDLQQTSRDIAEEFKQMTQVELKKMATDLETEGEHLQQTRGKEERLAKTITDQMHLEAQELLQLFGLPYIVCPMEAEAQCAYLDVTGQVDGVVTNDSDVWLFGGETVYKNFFNQDKHVEMFKITDLTKHLGLDRTRLIQIAVMCGSDYTEGVAGVGPVTALEILAEFPGEQLTGLKRCKEWWDEAHKQKKPPSETKIKSKLRRLEFSPGFPSEAVFKAYLEPTVDTSQEPFTWSRPDLDLLRDYSKQKLGWAKLKADEMLLPVMKKVNEISVQRTITSYFTPQFISTDGAGDAMKKKQPSKRLKRALNQINSSPTKPAPPGGASAPSEGASAPKRRSNRANVMSKREAIDKLKLSRRAAAKRTSTAPVRTVDRELVLSEDSSDNDDEVIPKIKKKNLVRAEFPACSPGSPESWGDYLKPGCGIKSLVCGGGATGRRTNKGKGRGKSSNKGGSTARPNRASVEIVKEVKLSESSSSDDEPSKG